MGQDQGTAGAAVTEAKDPEQIREEIEETRRELGDTVEALATKADIKTQAKQKIAETKAAMTGKKDELIGKTKDASPQSASSAAAGVTEKARQNPVPAAAAGAFAFGFLAGWAMRR
jgi:ElaB/YqjD/DUF883 family membrane-anchored ribosome-binding protein